MQVVNVLAFHHCDKIPEITESFLLTDGFRGFSSQLLVTIALSMWQSSASWQRQLLTSGWLRSKKKEEKFVVQ
jgi:hypothetical protein